MSTVKIGRGVVTAPKIATAEERKARAEMVIEAIILREERARINEQSRTDQARHERQKLIDAGVIKPT